MNTKERILTRAAEIIAQRYSLFIDWESVKGEIEN